jgi:hypothetical protein
MAGAAAAVGLSFVVVASFMRGDRRRPTHYSRLDLLRSRPGRCLADPRLRLAAQVIAVILLAVIVTASFIGDQNPTRNIAPITIWVIWWVGFAYLSALVGDLWSVLNPWAAIFGWIQRLFRRRHVTAAAAWPYPRRLGVWPAVLLFAAFAWIELVYAGRTIPAHLGVLTLIYSLITWIGMITFGGFIWLRYGDPFAVAFRTFATFAPTENRARGLSLRPYGAGLLQSDDVGNSMVVFTLLLLSSVTFDGFMATPTWSRIESALFGALAFLGGARLTVIDTLGLVACSVVFVLVYLLFARWIALAAGAMSTGAVARTFVLSLIPIAVAYHLAHSLSYLLIHGQLMIRLVSDPFGFGWNVFGTARYRPDIGIVGARFVWYTAVISIVVGHIIAVYVAHAIALREFRQRRIALRSQIPMLVLMVGYTVISLWILAQPIVETASN